jgi:hypothetical protein
VNLTAAGYWTAGSATFNHSMSDITGVDRVFGYTMRHLGSSRGVVCMVMQRVPPLTTGVGLPFAWSCAKPLFCESEANQAATMIGIWFYLYC